MTAKLDIPKLVVNYLNFLRNIENCSPHTLLAYSNDFCQAFELSQWGQFTIPAEQEPLSISFSGSVPKQALCWSSKQLETKIEAALSLWANLSPASKNRKFACLKGFLKWLYENNLTTMNLGNNIVCPKVPSRLPNFLSVDEAIALLTTIEEQFNNTDDSDTKADTLRDWALVLLLYGGGLRVHEAGKVQWNDLNFSNRQIRILGKGKKERLIALPQKCIDIIKKLPHTGPYLWGDTPISNAKAYLIVKNWGLKTGLLRPLHPHALRHSFATHLLSGGANLRTLQTILGHESLRATEKYTHLGIDQLARTMEKHHPLSHKTGK